MSSLVLFSVLRTEILVNFPRIRSQIEGGRSLLSYFLVTGSLPFAFLSPLSFSSPSLLSFFFFPLLPPPLPLSSPLHHTQKSLLKGAFFPIQWSKVFAPLWGRLINIPTAASLQGFYFCNSVGRSRGHNGEVKRKKNVVRGGGGRMERRGKSPSFHNKASKGGGNRER